MNRLRGILRTCSAVQYHYHSINYFHILPYINHSFHFEEQINFALLGFFVFYCCFLSLKSSFCAGCFILKIYHIYDRIHSATSCLRDLVIILIKKIYFTTYISKCVCVN